MCIYALPRECKDDFSVQYIPYEYKDDLCQVRASATNTAALLSQSRCILELPGRNKNTPASVTATQSTSKQDNNDAQKANLKVQMFGCIVQLALWSEPLACVNWGEWAGTTICGWQGTGAAAAK